jgi:queuine tRNA-ribosyltransferase
MARHHVLYTLRGRVNAMNAEFAEMRDPIDPGSAFPASTGRYSPAYLRHLFKAKEPTGSRIATLHNLAFYARLMQEIREAIENQSWPALAERYRHA